MKKNKGIIEAINLTLNGTLTLMGAITGIYGFIIMSTELVNSASIAETVLMAMLGLAMFTGGCFVVRLFSYQEDTSEDEDEDSPVLNYSLIAWNDTYLSWMRMVEFRSQKDWDFVLISPSGEVDSEIIKSEDDYYDYTWEEIEE